MSSSSARSAAARSGWASDLRTSLLRSTPWAPPGELQPSTSAPTRAGWSAASHWATRPPIDVPYTCARSTPASSSTASTSAANPRVLYGSSGLSLPPVPR
jgi:hypothetical protein